MDDINPIQVQKFLGGLDYPCTKDQLVEQARQNEAPEDVISLLENLPDKEYQDPTELSEQLGGSNGSEDDSE